MKTRSEKLFIYRLVVTGRGEFPIDMLRYDRCVPVSETDSHTITTKLIGIDRTVELFRYARMPGKATEARWNSFGWKIIREGQDQ